MKTIDEQLEELGRWRRELATIMEDEYKWAQAVLQTAREGECICRFCKVHVSWEGGSR